MPEKADREILLFTEPPYDGLLSENHGVLAWDMVQEEKRH